MTDTGDVALVVNGRARRVTTAPAATLLDVLRDDLGLTGSKLSCERGECGACTVLVDDVAVLSCVTLAALVDGEVTTVEGLAEPARDLREAVVDHGGSQCGYCTPGQVVLGHVVAEQGRARLEAGGHPDELGPWARHLMSGVICRCTGGRPIAEAVVAVARARAERGAA